MGWLFLVPIFAAVAVVLVFVVYAILQNRQERARGRRRIEDLARLARECGLEFHEKDPFGLPARLGGIRRFQGSENHARSATNVMHGMLGGRDAFAFDYECNDSDLLQRFSAVALLLDASFPVLAIRPQTAMDRVAEALGAGDVKLESSEFSKAFNVRSPDPRFAYDFCNPRMMEFLLAHAQLSVEVCGNWLVVTEKVDPYPDQNRWSAEQFRGGLRLSREIVNLIPEFLWKQYRETGGAAE